MESGKSDEVEEAAESTEDDRFRLRVTKDKMAILVDCDTEGMDLRDLAEGIVAKLMAFGVSKPPMARWVAEWLAECARKSAIIEGGILIQGMPPIPPVDGHIEWGGDFFNKGFERDEKTDRIDFRQRAGKRNVKSGQFLAKILDPTPGEDGYDVFGEKIRARKPRRRRIRVGPNVRFAEDSNSFYSEIEGRIRWAKELLAVDDLYEIQGNVGLETGHISHPGSVLVQQDVLEGARIEASGDVEVIGVVESAHIQTTGDVIVHGGITGENGAHIYAGGSVAAHYILDATVQAGGDIVVDREIVQSTVETRGAVSLPSGRIVGGKVVALEGVEAGQIGSAALVPTEIIAGEDYSLEGQLVVVRQKVETTKKNIEKIHASIDPLKGHVAELTEEKKQVVRTLLEQLSMMDKLLEELAEEEEELRAESRDRQKHLILIRNTLFPEVRLRIKGELFRSREEYAGPVKPVYTSEGVKIASTKIRSLRKASEEEEVDPDLII